RLSGTWGTGCSWAARRPSVTAMPSAGNGPQSVRPLGRGWAPAANPPASRMRGSRGDGGRTMHALLANGFRLYYETHGAGLPVVFLHGLSGTHDLWKYQVPAV